jgi:hypothetical protein
MSDKDTAPNHALFSIRRIALPILVICVLAYAYTHRSAITSNLPPFVQHWMGRATIDDRLAEYGPAARARLAPKNVIPTDGECG